MLSIRNIFGPCMVNHHTEYAKYIHKCSRDSSYMNNKLLHQPFLSIRSYTQICNMLSGIPHLHPWVFTILWAVGFDINVVICLPLGHILVRNRTPFTNRRQIIVMFNMKPYHARCISGKLDQSLHWRDNDHDDVLNHQPHACLLNRLIRRRSKKTSKLRVTGLCAGNSPGPVNYPHKGPVTRKKFPFDDVIMFHGLRCHAYRSSTAILFTISFTFGPFC